MIHLIKYCNHAVSEIEGNNTLLVDELLSAGLVDNNLWANLSRLEKGQIEKVFDLFHIESLVLFDINKKHHGVKLHEYDDCLYINIPMIYYDLQGEVDCSDLIFVLKENILISITENESNIFNPILERVRKRKVIRSLGVDYLLVVLLGAIVDHYLEVLNQLGEKIDLLDEEIMASESEDVLSKINCYKSNVNYLRKRIKPCNELVLNLLRLDSELIGEKAISALKRLQGNVSLMNNTLDNYRDILSDQLSIFHTIATDKLNNILKFLTIFSVIFIPLTFIVGVYGTNFKYLPELDYKYSYFIMWGVMIFIVIGMITFFKRKKWM